MKLIKGKDIVDFHNPGTIAAYKSAGYVEYKEKREVYVKQTKKTDKN